MPAPPQPRADAPLRSSEDGAVDLSLEAADRPLEAADAWLAALARVHDRVFAFDRSGQTRFAHDAAGAAAPKDRDAWLRDAPAAIRNTLALDPATTVHASVEIEGASHTLRRFHASSIDDALALEVVCIDLVRAPTPPATEAAALERRNQELESSLRGAAHDLRSPLVSVLGFTRLLRDEFGEPIGRTGRHFLDRIEQAGQSMQRLIDDLLELSRIEDMPTAQVHLNAVTVLEQVAADLKVPLDEAGVVLAFPTEAPILVCDRTRLYQLFSNLVGNAIRHAAGEDGGRIEVDVGETPTGWEIRVQDDGPGIAVEDRDRIFQAFETARAPRRPVTKRSSGLGLAIVRKIVEAHGGSIHVESEPGQGACFVVALPRPDDTTA